MPECRQCHKDAVHADAGVLNSIPYYYCRTCKIEVDRWGWEIKPKKPEGLNELEAYLENEIEKLDVLDFTTSATEAELEAFATAFYPPKKKDEDDEDSTIPYHFFV